MQRQYTSAEDELLGIAPIVAPIIAGVATLGTTIAGAVISKRSQRRSAAANEKQAQTDIRLAEIAERIRAAKSKDLITIAALGIGIPTIAFIIYKKRTGKNEKRISKRRM